jgi:hypothetical protein
MDKAIPPLGHGSVTRTGGDSETERGMAGLKLPWAFGTSGAGLLPLQSAFRLCTLYLHQRSPVRPRCLAWDKRGTVGRALTNDFRNLLNDQGNGVKKNLIGEVVNDKLVPRAVFGSLNILREGWKERHPEYIASLPADIKKDLGVFL